MLTTLSLGPHATPTSATTSASSAAAARSTSSAIDPAHTLWALTAFSGALLVLVLLPAPVDPRMLGDVVATGVWVKPAKFALSLIVFFATVAWVVGRLGPGVRGGRLLRASVATMGLAAIGEMVYIITQAGRGVASHFNFGTPLEAAMYNLMALGATLMVLGVALVGWLVRRDAGARLGPALREGIVLGFVGSTALTLVTAFTLGGNGGHFVGVPAAGSPVLPLFGWSGEVGDLRPAHFLALHAMQALPLLGGWLDRRATPPASGVRAVRLGLAVYALLTAAVFVQALMGLPLVRL